MLDIETMDVDLSIVKKENDDHCSPHGGLLDNFINEHDYNDCLPTSMPDDDDQDVNVDWLNSFLDEPLSDSMSGLNTPLADISHSATASVSRITSINCNSDMLLDSYSTFSEDYINNTMDTSSLKLSTAVMTKPSPTLRNNNPFLSASNSPTDTSKDLRVNSPLDSSVNENNNEISIKVEEDAPKCIKKSSNILKIDRSLLHQKTNLENHVQKQSTVTLGNKPQNQQKLLLFMNTPENRAKLAGTNFNIINANQLNKISGTSNNEMPKTSLNLINLKKCIKLNNTVKNEHCYQDSSLKPEDDPMNSMTSNSNTLLVNASLQTIMAQQQSGKKTLPVDVLGDGNNSYGFVRKDRDHQEIDSGYESPSSSSGSSPCSPPIELDRKDSCETLQYIDIPPHERQPFYLSEEERRTLVMEGLPVPQGLPLNKSEERALKKVRRKIKNKISAQESRRKKKEYMESLEKKVDAYASENNCLKKKISGLEVSNRSLITQVQKLQALVASKISTPTSNSVTVDSNEVIEVLQ